MRRPGEIWKAFGGGGGGGRGRGGRGGEREIEIFLGSGVNEKFVQAWSPEPMALLQTAPSLTNKLTSEEGRIGWSFQTTS